eukprot:g6440.t1
MRMRQRGNSFLAGKIRRGHAISGKHGALVRPDSATLRRSDGTSAGRSGSGAGGMFQKDLVEAIAERRNDINRPISRRGVTPPPLPRPVSQRMEQRRKKLRALDKRTAEAAQRRMEKGKGVTQVKPFSFQTSKRSQREREKAKLEKEALEREKIAKEKEKQQRKEQTELKRRQRLEQIRKRREEAERLLTSSKKSKKMTGNRKYSEKKKVELDFLARQAEDALRRRESRLMKETVKKTTYKRRRRYTTPKTPSFSTDARAKRKAVASKKMKSNQFQVSDHSATVLRFMRSAAILLRRKRRTRTTSEVAMEKKGLTHEKFSEEKILKTQHENKIVSQDIDKVEIKSFKESNISEGEELLKRGDGKKGDMDEENLEGKPQEDVEKKRDMDEENLEGKPQEGVEIKRDNIVNVVDVEEKVEKVVEKKNQSAKVCKRTVEIGSSTKATTFDMITEEAKQRTQSISILREKAHAMHKWKMMNKAIVKVQAVWRSAVERRRFNTHFESRKRRKKKLRPKNKRNDEMEKMENKIATVAEGENLSVVPKDLPKDDMKISNYRMHPWFQHPMCAHLSDLEASVLKVEQQLADAKKKGKDGRALRIKLRTELSLLQKKAAKTNQKITLDRKRFEAASIKIETWLRTRKHSATLSTMKLQFKIDSNAALSIQTLFRVAAARREKDRRKEKRIVAVKNIQRRMRGCFARRNVVRQRESKRLVELTDYLQKKGIFNDSLMKNQEIIELDTFLQANGLPLSIFGKLFSHDINLKLLQEMTEADMKEIKLTFGARKRLIEAIQKLIIAKNQAAQADIIRRRRRRDARIEKERRSRAKEWEENGNGSAAAKRLKRKSLLKADAAILRLMKREREKQRKLRKAK